jgi:hypothetical protein
MGDEPRVVVESGVVPPQSVKGKAGGAGVPLVILKPAQTFKNVSL